MRAIWTGNVTFGLVSIPVKLYRATEERGIKAHNLHSECHTPLVQKRWCPKCEKEVPWTEVEKGFKIGKDTWVVIKKEELEKIKLPTSKNMEVLYFVDVSQIDPIYFDKTYYLVPTEAGIKPYCLFVEALRIANKAAICRVVLRNKEYIVALRAYKKGIAAHVLYYEDEIKDINLLPELKNLVVVEKEELELAKLLISQMVRNEFSLKEFKDRYTEALEQLIKAKAEGKEFKMEEKEKVAEAKELMEALKASIEAVKKKKKVLE